MNIVRSLSYLVLSVSAVILLVGKASAQDQEVITNNTIIRMVKAKLGEDVIISKIRNSKTNFDLSTDSLIKLHEAAVSDNLINVMQNPQSQPTSASQPLNSPTPSSGGLFIVQGGKNVEMEYVAGFTKTITSAYAMGWSGSMKTKFVIMASGEKASFRIQGKTPAFYSKLHPSEIGLVIFDTDTYNKKPVRYVLRVGDMWQTQGQAAGPAQSNIDFDFKKEPNGLYKITLKAPLEKGEYAFIAPGTSSGGGPWNPSSAYKIFDFGVDE